MEIIPEGKLFRLVHDDELPSILKVLENHLPYALKVRRRRWSWLFNKTLSTLMRAGKLMQTHRLNRRKTFFDLFLPFCHKSTPTQSDLGLGHFRHCVNKLAFVTALRFIVPYENSGMGRRTCSVPQIQPLWLMSASLTERNQLVLYTKLTSCYKVKTSLI